jgi:hypothetical protein
LAQTLAVCSGVQWPISFLDSNLPVADRPKNNSVDAIALADVVGGVFEGQPVCILGYPEVVDKRKTGSGHYEARHRRVDKSERA